MRWLLFVALVACGDNLPDDEAMSFAKLDDETVSRLVSAGSGGDVWNTISRITGIGHTSACPHVEIVGTTVTITGGCTSADGYEYDGVARITNHWFSVDGGDARYELENFTITSKSGSRTVFDGFIQGIEGPYAHFDADLFVEYAGRLVRSELRKDCDVQTCRIDGLVELLGTGTATVSGWWAQEIASDYKFKLYGVDRVEAQPGEYMLGYKCFMWRIVGTDRTGALFCPR